MLSAGSGRRLAEGRASSPSPPCEYRRFDPHPRGPSSPPGVETLQVSLGTRASKVTSFPKNSFTEEEEEEEGFRKTRWGRNRPAYRDY